MFIAALFYISQDGNSLFPSIDEWIRKIWCVYVYVHIHICICVYI